MENGNESNPFGIAHANGSIATVDPGTIGSESPGTGNRGDSASAGFTGTEIPRKRGRPKGSRNRTSADKAAQTVRVDRDAISAILFSAHAMLAGITRTPELALDQGEAKTIAEATSKVAELYDVTADPKTIAWSNLIMTLGMVYGTRIVAINMRRKDERKKRAQSNVAPIRPDIRGDFSISPDGKLPPFDPPTRQ